MTHLPHPDHLHTTTQAAAALGLKPATIRQWRKRGLIKPADVMPGRGGPQPLYTLNEIRNAQTTPTG